MWMLVFYHRMSIPNNLKYNVNAIKYPDFVTGVLDSQIAMHILSAKAFSKHMVH